MLWSKSAETRQIKCCSRRCACLSFHAIPVLTGRTGRRHELRGLRFSLDRNREAGGDRVSLRYRSLVCGIGITLAIVALAHAEGDDGLWLDKKWQNDLVARVKATDVRRIDSALPSRHLDEWLRQQVGAGVELHWYVSGCDLKWEEPEPPGGYPLCVWIRTDYDSERYLSLQLLVGAYQSGRLRLREDRDPQLFETSLVWNGRVGSTPYECSGSLEQLSDLPGTIARLSSEACR